MIRAVFGFMFLILKVNNGQVMDDKIYFPEEERLQNYNINSGYSNNQSYSNSQILGNTYDNNNNRPNNYQSIPPIQIYPPNLNTQIDLGNRYKDNNQNHPQVANVNIHNGLTNLAHTLDDKIRERNPSFKNTILSPVCIGEILYMLMLASNGITKQELANVLGLNPNTLSYEQELIYQHEFSRLIQSLESSSNDKVYVTTATALFLAENVLVNQNFQNDISNIYKSEIQKLYSNIDTATIINNWVNQKTYGKIPTILDDKSNHTVVLVSTLYFNGLWKTAFTKIDWRFKFFPDGVENNNNVIYVDMMGCPGQYKFFKDRAHNFRIIGIPYKDESTVFYVVQPLKPSNRETLQQVKSYLTSQNIESVLQQMQDKSVLLNIPKMILSETMVLNQPLKQMGVQTLFNTGADLSNMFPPPSKWFVDEILHKVQVEITETGTIGTAAAAATYARNGGLNFTLNTPFMFFIRHEPTKLNLFWGLVTEPTPNYPDP